jgi:formimidoylglutamate deiminase
MYRLVAELDPDGVYAHSLRAFREMASAGFTAVGEFHYLHADREGRPYAPPDPLAQRVIEAARDAGLRIVLLNVYYARGGLRNEPLDAAQRRFVSGDVDAFLGLTRGLVAAYRDDPAVSIGVAVHSVRAVAPEDMRRIFEAARAEDWPCHMHLSEQPAEVEACRAAHGRTPVELVADLGGLWPGATGVHCTHIGEAEVERLAESGATVCACPTTEADLGDGFLRALDLRRAGVPIALGSDSQARIDPFEEMRAVEYHERLRHGRRSVLAGVGDPDSSVGQELVRMATRSGARSLALEVGELSPGRWADFVGLDLEHPVVAGWTDETLVELMALSADPRVVAGTWVAGERIA